MGRSRKYIIYTLNARELMNLCKNKNSHIDLNNVYEREKVLMEENRFAESALFSQIIRVSQINGDERPVREIMTKSLVYLDFERDISDVEEETRHLLEEGFYLNFRGDVDHTRFLPFDKSASMSRECTISFISETIFESVDKALDMGLRNAIEHFPSKYYAYRGLYMTDGIAIKSERFVLNEKTVVVIRTGGDTLEKSLGITVPATMTKDGKVEVSIDRCEPSNIEAEWYDGEGIISPEYAEIINRDIVRRRGTTATSFQVRLPFSKGMLHAVNFKRFIKDEFKDVDYNDLEIIDYFGIKRKLKDVEIVLTQSMFKCAKWLEGVTDDPMKYYFDNVAQYNHKMHVANTDIGIRSNKLVKLNYQFLNTLDLSKEILERIIHEHLINAENILKTPDYSIEALLNIDIFDDIENIDSERIKRMDSWEYALSINPSFVRDPMIRSRLKQAVKGHIRDTLTGRVSVKGCVRYLSGDLLKLLIDIAEKCNIEKEDRIKELESECLLPDRFYICGISSGNTGIFHPRKYYGVLRSPHLSRNEQCALRPYSSDIYGKYFGNLKGVVMVSNYSDAPAAMSGADFDGDMVKIIMDEDINNAILNTVYESDPEKGLDSHGVIHYRRILPVPVINSPRGKKEMLGKFISYDNLKASFAGRVGHISNLAIRIAKQEYSVNGTIPVNSAALCTIATGLEIDSVKSGANPDTTYLESLCTKDEDQFLVIHNNYKKAVDEKRSIHTTYNESIDEYTAYYRYKKKKDKELFRIRGDQDYNIDYLPYYYAKALHEGVGKGRQKINNSTIPEYSFTFELYDNWREQALNDSRIEKLKGIIGAYKKLRIDSWNIGYEERKYSEGTARSKVATLLDVEYETGIDRLYRSGEYIEEALETAYQELYDAVRDEKHAKEILDLLVDTNWQYAPSFEDKVKILKDIFDEKDISLAALEIICDTYDNGFQILNYILRDIRDLYKLGSLQLLSEEDIDNDEQYSEGILSPWKGPCDKDLFKRLFSGYRDYYTKEDYAKTDWMEDAATVCREEVLDLFDGDIDSAIECTVALDKKMDKNHRFLWDVFDADDFSGVLYDDRK